MNAPHRPLPIARGLVLGALFLALPAAPALSAEDPISAALMSVDEDVRAYNDHIVFLASPFLGGRLPGTQGMEIASQYMEHHFALAGLSPAFDLVEKLPDGTEVVRPRESFRQPFPMGGTTEVTRSVMAVSARGGEFSLVAGTDFTVTGMGGSGTVSAPMVFVGYGLESGPDGYTSFGDLEDLSGRVALVLRFEPMNEQGVSLWSPGGGWSGAAAFANKVGAVARRNPEAIIIINPPGAADPRSNTLMGPNEAGGRITDVPVVMMSHEAGDRLVKACDGEGRSLLDLRRMADAGTAVVPMRGAASLDIAIERRPLIAENVGGLLPGRGNLEDEIIVIGAHLDHIGMGYFGSRSGPGALHPGADDNASGSAGLLLMARWLSDAYAELPEDANLRTIMFLAFSAEESGLNGSRYYVRNPIVPLDQHTLMLNFDMIGRIVNRRLSVSGTGTAEGFGEFLQPFFDDSPLTVVANPSAGGGSDHLPFLQSNIPILFGIIADFHGDYHTPGDVSEKINRVDAVHASRLFSDIALAVAQRQETLVFTQPPSRAARGGRGGPGNVRVRVGIVPGNYDGEGGGVLLNDVSEDGAAAAAGFVPGDRIVRWDGQKVGDIQEWMELLARHRPGDEVNVGVVRDDAEITITITLQGR